MIRPAKMADIMRLVELLHELHKKSKYRDFVEIDKKAAREVFEVGILRNNFTNAGGTFVIVSVADQKVEGFFYGVLDRVYHVGKQLSAKDVYFYMSPKANKTDAPQMFDAYLGWARRNPKVVEINASWTDVTDSTWRIGDFYIARGMRECGRIYEEIVREPQRPYTGPRDIERVWQ